jgi:hypothetical protein
MIRLDKLNDHSASAFWFKLPVMTGNDTTCAEESTLSRAAIDLENLLESLLILQITLTRSLPGVGDESEFGQNSQHGGENLPSRETWQTRNAGHRSRLLPPTRLFWFLTLRGPGKLSAAHLRGVIPPVTAMLLWIDGFGVVWVEWK